MTNKNYMAQLGATLVDRGFPILPIQPNTKKPGLYKLGAWHEYPKWSRHCERDTTDNEVDVWGNWPEAGIGIAAGRGSVLRLGDDRSFRQTCCRAFELN